MKKLNTFLCTDLFVTFVRFFLIFFSDLIHFKGLIVQIYILKIIPFKWKIWKRGKLIFSTFHIQKLAQIIFLIYFYCKQITRRNNRKNDKINEKRKTEKQEKEKKKKLYVLPRSPVLFSFFCLSGPFLFFPVHSVF